MADRVYSDSKQRYVAKLQRCLAEHTSCLVVAADNVGSYQIQQIRAALRGKAEILMGKNTQIRRVIREAAVASPDLNNLLPFIVGNVGLVFTNDNLKNVRDVVLSVRVPAAAKPGAIAPVDVWVPAGPTGLDPGQTAFFQSLSISTKIARGSIEILTDVHLIKAGDKVGNSEVALLSKLNIRPFSYGFSTVVVYDMGSTFAPEVLDITDDVMLNKFFNGLAHVAAVGLALGIPSVATVPHSIVNAFKKLVSVAVETEINFAQADAIKAYLADPSAFAVAAAPAAGAAGAAAAAVEEVEEESEEDMGGGGGLFGDNSDSDSDSD